MADGSRVRVTFVQESTYGTTPGTPTMLRLPITGVTLQDRLGFSPSNVIVPNRDVDDVVRLSQAGGGTIPMELRYSPAAEGLSVSMLGLMCGASYTASASTGTCTIPGGTKTITKAAFAFATDFAVGDVVRVSGSTVAADNGYYRVTASTTGTLTVDHPSTFTAGGANVTVTRGARLVNGSTAYSYTIEVAYLDLQVAHIFRGCVINTADLAVTVGGLTTWTLGVEAQSTTRVNNTGTTDQFITGATYPDMTDAPTLDPIGVAEVRMTGVDYAASALNLTISNNVRAREQIGTLGPVSMSRGQFSATGRVTAYFDNFTDHTAFATNALGVLWWAMLDADGKGWSFALPEVKFTDLSAPTNGGNSDIFKNLTLQAFRDATEGCTVRLQRWD